MSHTLLSTYAFDLRPLEVAEERAICEDAFREDCLRTLPFNGRVPQRPNKLGVTRECLRLLQARLIGAAFSLGTFFVAVDKESASPVGATTHYPQPFRTGKTRSSRRLKNRLLRMTVGGIRDDINQRQAIIIIQKQQTTTVKINPNTGLIENIPYIASPNCDARPENTEIDLIVIHSICLPPGEYGGTWIEKFFTNQLPADEHPYFGEIKDLKVSSHVLIHRDGSVQQFVPFTQRAWHAGESCYGEREACNDFSIGIELEGTDDSAFENEQYQSLAKLILSLEKSYTGISREHIIGHSDIAPDRKTDPGTGFDWDKLKGLLS